MGIKLNLKDVQSSFDAIDAGTYDATITGGEMKETKGDGKLGKVPMINWEFTVKDDDKYTGRKLWTNTIIHDTTLFRLKQLLLASGEFEEDDMDDLDFEIEELIGADVQLIVVQREYEGEMRNDIKKIQAIPSGGVSAKKIGAVKKTGRKL